VPRISDERRAANRTTIIDAARHCFARDGFHQTSMPDLAAEAGISAGAFYRYFTGKDEVVREIAREAFAGVGAAVAALLEQTSAPSVADVLVAVVAALDAPSFPGGPADDRSPSRVEDQFRCAVQAWGETLRDPGLRAEAAAGIDHVAGQVAAALARGQQAGRVPPQLDPADGARLVVTVLPGLVVGRTVLGHDSAALLRAARALLDG